MFWDDILILAEEGRDIGSHSMNHKKLKLSDEEMKYEIIESKKCLEKNGIDVTSFSFPYNDGYNDKNIIKIIADNYYISRTCTEPLMLFQCINERNFIGNKYN
jgi:peptidoglycan/xylan/chitin deacetylase (PgdA/CDA1 family)